MQETSILFWRNLNPTKKAERLFAASFESFRESFCGKIGEIYVKYSFWSRWWGFTFRWNPAIITSIASLLIFCPQDSNFLKEDLIPV